MLKHDPAVVNGDKSQFVSNSINKIKDWITVLVSVENPPSESLKGLDRSERHQLLCRNAKKRYGDIVEWIDDQEIESEFARIGSPTLFSTITMVCTPRGAELITKAPGVTRVVSAPHFVLNGT